MSSSYVLYGAGAVGGVVGARLHLAGHRVTLVARGEHLARIRARGLTLDTADGREVVRTDATDSAAEVDWRDGPVVLLAVKAHQTDAALADLMAHAPPSTAVVCLQNGVSNEPATLRRFARTYGITVMLPSEHLEPGLVVQGSHPVPGILDVGRYPTGTDALAEQVAADLRSAGFASVPRPDIMAWKHRKLVTNAVGDAGVVLPDASEELREALRAECEAVLAAAGAPLVTQEADRERRGDLLQVRADARGSNSLGQSLQRGTPGTEVDFRAGEIVLLGRRHGVPTPLNERVQRAAYERLRSTLT
ncbi:2-dehydropantoate 2-reductase [Nocardioides anomalus]|uniref:2-dehydropantoate 2-reductase n=1 Tax=Nocardioides anomalus TaxID=2712223 RepID=A0A6G6W959_9ACTN|nr:2-dehydropantoate 2-reductase [Nocardioides anomalus]QIG41756.1 2-dehydropantoate 2-reductase [Nocardioides anomalus]